MKPEPPFERTTTERPESQFWTRLQLIRESELRQVEKHLLYVLFFYAGDDGDCWPAAATLARDISATPRQVRRTMRGLEKAKLITITPHAGRSNSVRINWQGVTKKAGVTEAPGVTESTREGGQIRQGTPVGNVRGPLSNLSPKHKRNTQGTQQGTPKRVRRTSARFNAADVDLPLGLNTPEFRHWWQQWCTHREDKRKPLTERAVSIELEDLAKVGMSDAIEAIRTAIKSGWTGVFPKPGNRASQSESQPAATRWLAGKSKSEEHVA